MSNPSAAGPAPDPQERNIREFEYVKQLEANLAAVRAQLEEARGARDLHQMRACEFEAALTALRAERDRELEIERERNRQLGDQVTRLRAQLDDVLADREQ